MTAAFVLKIQRQCRLLDLWRITIWILRTKTEWRTGRVICMLITAWLSLTPRRWHEDKFYCFCYKSSYLLGVWGLLVADSELPPPPFPWILPPLPYQHHMTRTIVSLRLQRSVKSTVTKQAWASAATWAAKWKEMAGNAEMKHDSWITKIHLVENKTSCGAALEGVAWNEGQSHVWNSCWSPPFFFSFFFCFRGIFLFVCLFVCLIVCLLVCFVCSFVCFSLFFS